MVEHGVFSNALIHSLLTISMSFYKNGYTRLFSGITLKENQSFCQTFETYRKSGQTKFLAFNEKCFLSEKNTLNCKHTTNVRQVFEKSVGTIFIQPENYLKTMFAYKTDDWSSS